MNASVNAASVNAASVIVFTDGAGMEWSSYEEIISALEDAICRKAFEEINFLEETANEWIEAELYFIHGIELPASEVNAIRLCSSVVPTGTILNFAA